MAALNVQGLVAILHGIGAPVTAGNLAALVGWEKAEGGSASFNPFNTTLPEPGASSYNSVGVRNYVSEQQGVRATIATLQGSAYSGVIAQLRRGNNPAGVAAAVGASPWGTPNFAADIPNVHTIAGVEALAAGIPGAKIGSGNFFGLTPLGNTVKNALTNPPNPLSGLDAIAAELGKLTDPSVWMSGGFVLIGLVLILMGVLRLLGPKLQQGLAAGGARQAADLAVAA